MALHMAPRPLASAALLSCVPLAPQLQFVLTIIQTSCGVVWPCTFPLGWLYFQIGYMISLIVLFTNFYVQVILTFLWCLGLEAASAKILIHLTGTCGTPAACWALGSNVTVTGQLLPLGGVGSLPVWSVPDLQNS